LLLTIPAQLVQQTIKAALGFRFVCKLRAGQVQDELLHFHVFPHNGR